VTVRDEAHLRRGHNDQSRQGHQCSETTLTGESRFHTEPGSLMTGSKRVVHWTCETWYECSEIVGSPQNCCKEVYEKCLRIAHLHSCSSTVYSMLLGLQRGSGGNPLTNSRGRGYHNCCQSDGMVVATLSKEFWQPASKYIFICLRCFARGFDSRRKYLVRMLWRINSVPCCQPAVLG
jgi:hypothetical protein